MAVVVGGFWCISNFYHHSTFLTTTDVVRCSCYCTSKMQFFLIQPPKRIIFSSSMESLQTVCCYCYAHKFHSKSTLVTTTKTPTTTHYRAGHFHDQYFVRFKKIKNIFKNLFLHDFEVAAFTSSISFLISHFSDAKIKRTSTLNRFIVNDVSVFFLFFFVFRKIKKAVRCKIFPFVDHSIEVEWKVESIARGEKK